MSRDIFPVYARKTTKTLENHVLRILEDSFLTLLEPGSINNIYSFEAL